VSEIETMRKPVVRPDFVPLDAYVSPKYVELERQKLWPKTWLLACREAEVEAVGQYVTFDIGLESILIVRSDESTVRAFYNVCQHRGRRLKDDYCGMTGKQVVCNFHGWRYRLDGELLHIVSADDWVGCSSFDPADLGLKPVKIDTWGGWIFVSMDPDIEPLLDYLAPIPAMTRPFEFEKLRIGWHKVVVVPCNWKVVVDAFSEGYHGYATHRTITEPMPSPSRAFGRHDASYYPHRASVPDSVADLRQITAAHEWTMVKMAHCISTPDSARAAERLKSLPDGMTNVQIYDKWLEYYRELIEQKGAEWPQGLTREFLSDTPADWHIFPNCTAVPAIDGILWHRMRPNGDDHTTAIWDIWSLVRPAPGDEAAQRELFPSVEQFKGQNEFLEEDFSNMGAVQKGMQSRGFGGARTNPVQEVTVSHFHETLYQYLYDRT
jgi:phenylpropionate dioxygenase-like ring-hydroxylating dioxygenase large terminal subunit